MPHPHNLPSLRLYYSLAIGMLAVWFGVSMYALMEVETQMRGGGAHESLAVDATGALIIESYSTAGGVYRTLPRRYPDGKEVESPYHSLLPRTSLPSGNSRRGLLDGPINWTERLLSIETGGKTTWYLVRNAAPEGRAYIVGYDKASRLPIQYVGRDGFRPTHSDRMQPFAVGGPLGYAALDRVAGLRWTGGLDLSYASSVDESATPETTLFLLDGDDVLEINVETASLRTISKAADANSLAIVALPVAGGAADPMQYTGPDGVEIIQAPMATRLAVRTRTSVIILDPREPGQVEFKLPADLQSAAFDVYALGPETLLIDRAEREGDRETKHHLTWIEAGGNSVRSETVTLPGSFSQDMRKEAIVGATLLPMLAILLPVMLLLAPSTMLQRGDAASLQDAYWQTLSAMWPAALGLAILSLVAAYLVLRWERKHGRPHPRRWAVATFLLGVPGFIAYILLHGRKSLAAPRRERPATPALLGTELFA